MKIIQMKKAQKKKQIQEPELPFWKKDTFTEKSPSEIRRYVKQALDIDDPEYKSDSLFY